MLRSIKVLKFGGSSLGTVDRIRSVASIISSVAAEFHPIVIVSALEGVTDQLVYVAEENDWSKSEDLIHAILARHLAYAEELLVGKEVASYGEVVESIRIQLWRRITLGALSEAIRDEILATGERLSAPLVAATLRSANVHATAWDAASLVRTDSTFGEASLDWVTTAETIQRWYQSLEGTAIITGFVGSDASGRTTTLGRGGSDYSAAIFASALGASVLERWTDVDGIYTDDPAVVRTAKRLKKIPLDEAATLNRDGKIGMHRAALDPIERMGIPVHVRSTLSPNREGTWIVPKQKSTTRRRRAR